VNDITRHYLLAIKNGLESLIEFTLNKAASCLVAMLLMLNACSHHPSQKLYTQTHKFGMKQLVLQTNHHSVTGFIKSDQDYTSSETLRVYLEGDGRPWFRGREPAINPTSQTLIALGMMLADTMPSIYLNRPCYGYWEQPANCTPNLWTSARYSATNIDALDQAMDQLKQVLGVKSLILIGYSGGGTIATLLAKERNDVSALVTVAANLDHVAWTNFFNQLPLFQSNNAVDVFPLSAPHERWHLVGSKDKIVPPSVAVNAAKKDRGAKIITYEHFDHQCCWRQNWPNILQQLGLTTNPN